MPLAPFSIQSAVCSSSQIDLALSGAVSADHVDIERSVDDATWVTIGSVAYPSVSRYSDTGLNSGTLYYYQALQKDSSGSTIGTSASCNATTAPCDPEFADVALLLNFDGASGSTTILDSSLNALTVTNLGSVALVTNPAFGTACGNFPGDSSSGLSVPSTAGGALDLSTTDFTIEFLARQSTSPGPPMVVFDCTHLPPMPGVFTGDPSGDFYNQPGFALYFDAGSLFTLGQIGAGGDASISCEAASTFADGNWHQFAAVRSGDDILLFIDYVLQSTTSLAAAAAGSSWDGNFGVVVDTNNVSHILPAPVSTIGCGYVTGSLGSWYVGQLDALRISRIVRYSASFTPPTAPFGGACPFGGGGMSPETVIPGVGDALSVAQAALTTAGFLLGSITEAVSSEAVGIVIATSPSGSAFPGTVINLTIVGVSLAVTGDQADIASRVNALLPVGWFTGLTPLKDALITGIANVFAFIYALFGYLRLQTRIATATDGFLELVAGDFFATALPRNSGETDASYRTRIQTSLFLEKGTRADVIRVITQLTGNAPLIVEPSRPADCGGYGIAMGYSVGGHLGSRVHPYQAFISVARGTSASDATLYAAIASVLPEATIAWVKLS